jgi:hypothetical protein
VNRLAARSAFGSPDQEPEKSSSDLSPKGENARFLRLFYLPAVLFLTGSLVPVAARWSEQRRVSARVATLANAGDHGPTPIDVVATAPIDSSGPLLLASWQTIGGCGAGASTGSGGGIKWIGRGVTGGAFNTQWLTSYTRLDTDPTRVEHHLFGNALVMTGLGDRWMVGANVPVVYKYMHDPFRSGADLSNSGLGDISLMVTRKLGPIGATALTATVGLPTGQYDGTYKLRILNQSQQRGFGKPTASLMLDHVGDETWGLTVLGASASWRGGENAINNYRAPSASTYAYAGYFLGPLVPAIGLTLTGLTGHDRDQTVQQITGLYLASPSVSIEWSTDWIAILVGASFPYQYDGVDKDTEGRARTPHGWGPWTIGVGFELSPF